MKLGKLLCQILIGIIVSFLGFIGLIVFRGYQMGEFNQIKPYGIEQCESVKIPTEHQSCEDVQELSDNSLLISCGSLFDALHFLSPHYIPYWNYENMSQRISNFDKNQRGTVYRLTKDSKFKKPIPVKIKKYVHPDFVPHGMSTITTKTGQDFVYIVNHRRDGEFLSVFKVDIDKNELSYWTSIYSDSFYFINNVAIVPDTNGNFYHSNWMKNDPGSWMGVFEMMGGDSSKFSQVQYCETPQDFLSKRPNKNIKVECKVVVDALPDANGVTLTNDASRLFVVSGHHLNGYNIDADTKEVTLFNEIDTKYPCDNVNASPTDDNDLWVACFPKPLGLMIGIQTYPNCDIAASVYRVEINSGKIKRVTIDPDGRIMSGGTGAMQINQYLVGVSVFDDSRFMVCDFATKIKV